MTSPWNNKKASDLSIISSENGIYGSTYSHTHNTKCSVIWIQELWVSFCQRTSQLSLYLGNDHSKVEGESN